jgi:hypothetical protein
MSTTLTCLYSAFAVGSFTGAQLATKVGAAPLDSQLVADYGLAVGSDSTGNIGATVTRTIVLNMNPTVAATATAALGGGNNGTGILVTITAGGSGYAAPPVVTAQTQAGHPAPIRPALLHAVIVAGVVTQIVIDDPGLG